MNSRDHAAPIRIRDANLADAETIAVFMAREFHETFAPFNTPADMSSYVSNAFVESRQAEELTEAGSCYLLMESGNELIAIARLLRGASATQVAGTPQTEIQRFYVRSSWHGRGIAQLLMQECLARAEHDGARTIWLGVWDQNARAIRFYEKCGFIDVGATTFMLGQDIQSDRVMSRALTRSPVLSDSQIV